MSIKDKLFLENPSELTSNLLFSDESVPTNKFYVGKVIDNNDPDKKLRVKVRVYGLMGNEIPDSDIPWAAAEDSYMGSNIGSVVIPPVGCIVRVYFENDDIYTPVYTSKVTTDNIPEDVKNDYPNNMVLFNTDAGDSFIVNRTNGMQTYQHRSGTSFVVDTEGNVTVKSVKNISFEADGDISFVSNNGSIDMEAEAGYINLGRGAIVPVPNLPTCLANGSPHAICGQAITMKGIARVKK